MKEKVRAHIINQGYSSLVVAVEDGLFTSEALSVALELLTEENPTNQSNETVQYYKEFLLFHINNM